jgi:predicted O-methyltransferase YrrM
VTNFSANGLGNLLAGRLLPGLARRVVTGAEHLRRAIKKVEIRVTGFENTVAVKPVADIPYPALDLATCADPVAAIMAAPEFAPARAFFADNPVTSRSLETPTAHALLYCLLRNLRPDHVFEIGTYRAGTTEAICRALCANGNGVAHTVDPFTGDYAEAVVKHWPPELLRHVELYPMNSMTFYTEMRRRKIRPGLVFVDGEHDYEYALFDICGAARAIAPGGFMFIDNIDQAGPFLAARDFASVNPGWRELGSALRDYDPEKAFDPKRNVIDDTVFIALRAAETYFVDERPRTFALTRWQKSRLEGVRIRAVAPRQPGKLIVQAVFRGFSTGPSAETMVEAAVDLQPGGPQEIAVAFNPPLQLQDGLAYYTVEPWLIWRGQEPLQLLQLLQLPEPY